MNTKKKSKQKKKKLSLTTKTIIIVSLLFVTLLGSFIGTYYTFSDKSLSKYEKGMKEAIAVINTANLSTKDLVKDKPFNSDVVKSSLPKILKQLDNATKMINAQIPGEKYKEQQKYILAGLEQNKLMYKQMLNILQNLQSQDLPASIQKFKGFENECETQYSLFNMNNTSISLPDDTIKFIEKFQSYTNELIKVTRDSDIKNKQTHDYFTHIDNFIAKFQPLKTDFSAELKKVRNSSISFDDVINTINQFSEKCSDIKKELLNINVPQNCSNIQQNITKIFEDYNLFCQNLISDINNEKSSKESSGNNLDKDSLKDTYSNSNNSYLALNDKYTNFINSYSIFKNNNLN